MKKNYFLFSFIILLSTNIFSMGIGIQINSTPVIPINENETSLSIGASFTIKPDITPLYFQFDTNYNVIEDYLDIKLCSDYRFLNKNIIHNWNWYCSVGLALGTNIHKNRTDITVAPRAIIGTDLSIFDGFLEPFFQIVAQPNIIFNIVNSNQTFIIETPISAGIRIWF